MEHEVLITEVELRLGVSFTRNVAVGKTVADAFFVQDGDRFYVEIDNETMRPKQMREKWQRYGNVEGYILVVCHTKSRLRKLIRNAEKVKSVALFTRLRWLQSQVKEVWIDWHGRRVRI